MMLRTGLAIVFAAAFALVALAEPSPAYAWRRGGGVYVEVPLGAPYYAPYPYAPYPYYYAAPPAVMVAPPPSYVVSPPQTVIVTQPQPQGAPAPQYWYYCDNPAGYYPYVQSCNGTFRPVPTKP
jgi:hypothetical protein